MKRTCVQCGKEFELTNSEIGFYKKRKLSLPKRCKECREQNRKKTDINDGSDKVKNDSAERNRRVNRTDGSNRKVDQTDRTNVKVGHAAAQSSAGNRSAVNSENTGRKMGTGRKLSIPALIILVIALLYSIVTGQFSSKDSASNGAIAYTFRTEDQFEDHYEKHGVEMGFDSAEEYLEAANLVIVSPDALHKIEAEDGDDIYFLEDTNEFVVVSTDGYIRTYFEPEDGIEYYERQ